MLLTNTRRWNRLKTIFEEAAELDDPLSVDILLRAECAGDEELLSEARRLLNIHGEAGLVLDTPLLNRHDRQTKLSVIWPVRN